MRKLATVRKVLEAKIHPNADKLGIYIIDGWQVIDQKEKYVSGDEVIYLEIDSFLPLKEEFEFLRKTSFKKMGVYEGFRLKTIRLRGELSQGMILPMSYLPEGRYDIGQDVSELLGIVKYEPPLPANLSGDPKGLFPGYIPKTDEERVQNMDYDSLKEYTYTITEKLDGSSCTMFYSEDGFGVCSRNLELKDTADNAMWTIAKQLNVQSILEENNLHYALQGELIGFRIQSNPYKINDIQFRLFKIYDIDAKRFLGAGEMKAWADKYGILTVPILDEKFELPENVSDLLAYADGKSILNPNANREGIVLYANENKHMHFKAISNAFLEENED